MAFLNLNIMDKKDDCLWYHYYSYLTAYLLQIFVKFRLKINSLTCNIIYLFIPTCSALLERSHKMLHDLFSSC